MLHLRSVNKNFKQDGKVESVILEASAIFEKGKSYAITGPSGSGKSTLMHCMTGIDTITSGSIEINGTDLFRLSDLQRACVIVLVTQSPFLIKELSVQENICLAGQVLGMNKVDLQADACKYLDLVGLYDMKDRPIGDLSGGQRHRVALARALIVKPQFLCADEITGSLDEKTGQEIILFLKKFCKQEHIGLIISSHNQAVIEQMEIVFTLKNGILT